MSYEHPVDSWTRRILIYGYQVVTGPLLLLGVMDVVGIIAEWDVVPEWFVRGKFIGPGPLHDIGLALFASCWIASIVFAREWLAKRARIQS